MSQMRILVVEDELLIGLDIKAILEQAGYTVLGPASTVEGAMQCIGGSLPDAAVLDINLGRELSFPIADALVAGQVPFVFLTAYNRAVLPTIYRDAPVITKPFVPHILGVEMARMLGR